MSEPRPPRVARAILERWTDPSIRAFLIGDLEERFAMLARPAPTRARLWYWSQTVRTVAGRAGPAGSLLRSMSGLGWDARHATRSLARSPAHALVAVLTLGVGIGAVGTAFSVLWGTVLRGLPFEEAGQLVHFERADVGEGLQTLAVTPHDYVAWREGQRSFEDLGAYVEATALLPVEGSSPEAIAGVRISANTLPLLRVEPTLGRGFSLADEEPGAPPVILLSHELWTRRFGADGEVVGRAVIVDGRPTTVVGVMAQGFGFPIAEEFWYPLRLDFTSLARGEGRLDVFGRLRNDVGIGVARADLERVTSALAEEYPATNAGIQAVLKSFSEEYVGPEFVSTVRRLLIAGLLVLLVCCANVANLLLLKGIRQRRDLAIRLSIGATRAHLLRRTLVEAGILAAAGSMVGVALTFVGVAWFNDAARGVSVFNLPHGSDVLFWWNVAVEPVTLFGVVLVAGASALLAGTAPALNAARRASRLTRGRRSDGVQSSGGRVTAGLVTVQLALTYSLLVAAGLTARSAGKADRIDRSFSSDGVLVATIPLASVEPDQRRFLAQRLIARFEAEPGIQTAAVTTELPLSMPRRVAARVDGDQPEAREAGLVLVGPQYFQAFDVSAEEGRLFDPTDGPDTEPVAIVNRSFAQRRFPGQGVVGRRIQLGEDTLEPWVTVVGVVRDLWERPGRAEQHAGIYLPIAQAEIGDPEVRLGRWGLGYPDFVLSGRDGEMPPAEAARRAVFEVAPGLAAPTLVPMTTVTERRVGRYRVWSRFYAAFGAVALFLAVVGVYGVFSFAVTLRAGEFGVRRALGASSRGLAWEVLRSALVRVAVGSAIGFVIGSMFVRGLTQVLYDVDPMDLGVYGAVTFVLALAALGSSWIPARKAACAEPLRAMRGDVS